MLRIRSLLLLPAVLIGAGPLLAQVERYAATIVQEDLRRHLEVIASDSLEGRETGSPGQKKAAEYLKEHFKAFGIAGVPDHAAKGMSDGYLQSFVLETEKLGGLGLWMGNSEFVFLKDHVYMRATAKGPVGEGGLVLVSSKHLEAPIPVGTRTVVLQLEEGKSAQAGSRSVLQQVAPYLQKANDAGVELILLVGSGMEPIINGMARHASAPRMRFPEVAEDGTAPRAQVFLATPAVLEAVLAHGGKAVRKQWRKKGGKPMQVAAPLHMTWASDRGTVHTENVLAYIPGTDLKDEVVVITAHYDHIGIEDGEVYNGADDNGSGTVALIEMAEAFALATKEGHGPRRSVLIMAVSGEERGLLGSQYYSDNPVFPLSNTVADLNIDMIGRVDTVRRTSDGYIYVIGSDRLSSELHTINEEANKEVGLDLDYRYNAEDDPNRFYYRSDHYNFAKHGIPSIFYFSGVHEDYHGPKDEVDRIRFDLVEQRARLVFRTAWELANRNERIVVDRP